MQVYSQSDIGLKRLSNQDYCLSGRFSDEAVWAVVCDGMGGANGGSTASRVAAETIAGTIESGYRSEMSSEEIKELMELAVGCANHSVYDMSIHVPGLSGMGTTVVCAIAGKETVHVIHAGDSRAYLYNDESLTQLTTDHSIVQEMVTAGELTPEQARQHYMKNIITRALGTEPYLKTDYISVPFGEGAKLIICTDGMSNYITDESLFEFIRTNSCDELTEKLIESSKELGGSDNITVAVIAG